MAFAALDLSSARPGQGEGGAMVFKDIPSTLTKAGAAAFNGMYGAFLAASGVVVAAGAGVVIAARRRRTV